MFGVSPEGGRLFVIRFSAVDRVYRLSIIDLAAGGERELVTRKYPFSITGGAWHPDGKSIVITSFVPRSDSNKIATALFSIDLASRRVTPVPSPGWKEVPSVAWLPDRSGIIVTAFDGTRPPQLWLLQPNGTARVITSDVSAYGYTGTHWTSITVTSDAKNILTMRSDVTSHVWMANADGSGSRPLTHGAGTLFGLNGVRWLPDGNVLYSVFTPPLRLLRVASPDGRDLRDLNRTGQWTLPDVSPDGRRIAFATGTVGMQSEIWTSDLNGLDVKELTHLGSSAVYPSWSPDGKEIVFGTYGKIQRIWRIPANGGTPEQLTDRPTDRPRLSPDGRRLLCY